MVAKNGLDYRRFFISRLFRIYPLYLFVTLFICVAVGFKTAWHLQQPLHRVVLEVVKWLGFRTPDINNYVGTPLIVAGVTWTLLYEAWFYVSLPFLTAIFLGKRAIWEKVLYVIAVVVFFRLNHLDTWIAATFFGGVAAVYWRQSERRIEFARSIGFTFLALTCLAGEFVFLYDPFNFLGLVCLTIFFIAIASGNTLFGLLRLHSALWLGEASYSIYLCHGILLWIAIKNFVPRISGFQYSTVWFVASAICLAPLLILFSSSSYLLLERPFIALGHRLSKPRA